MTWELRESGRYDILDAYADKPHREFMAADSDDSLRVFVRRWGPLRYVSSGFDAVSWYRKRRAVLDATMRFFVAIGTPELRAALVELLLVSEEQDSLKSFFRLYSHEYGNEGDNHVSNFNNTLRWCESASFDEIEQVSDLFIDHFPITAMPSFVVHKRGRQRVLRTSLFINNLHEALWWMVWEDFFRDDPIRFCEECGTLIPNDNKHFKKYCPGRCAKLVADRNYAARKRKEQKRLERARGRTR